jgi:hypothetical protein
MNSAANAADADNRPASSVTEAMILVIDLKLPLLLY